MSIKLIYMRTGEEVISEVKEIAHPESGEPIGYHMHKPFRLDIVQQNIEFNSDKGYQLEWFPWAPLSKDRDFFIPGSQVITVYEPLDSLVSQYISAIDETRYEENVLLIRSKAAKDTMEEEYMHRGVATRTFARGFNLADDVEVGEVTFKDGLLTIPLKKIIPDHQALKVYDIN